MVRLNTGELDRINSPRCVRSLSQRVPSNIILKDLIENHFCLDIKKQVCFFEGNHNIFICRLTLSSKFSWSNADFHRILHITQHLEDWACKLQNCCAQLFLLIELHLGPQTSFRWHFQALRLRKSCSSLHRSLCSCNRQSLLHEQRSSNIYWNHSNWLFGHLQILCGWNSFFPNVKNK